jgi:hypothetical protein
MSLCCLYFVVTGIQFWMTAYCIKVLDEDPGLVTIVYSLCSITAPIPGAAMGGYLADKNVRFLRFINLGWLQRQECLDSHQTVYSIRYFSFHIRRTNRILNKPSLHHASSLELIVLWRSIDSDSNRSCSQ